MHNSIITVIYVYILITTISIMILLSSIKKSNKVQSGILILLSIGGIWSILLNIFWIFNEDRFSINDRIPLFSEYTNYVVTNPIVLIVLAWFAMNKIANDKSLFLIIIASDVLMLFLGALAEYSTSMMRYVWYGLGFIPFALIMVILWHSLRLKAKSHSRTLYKSYLLLSVYITFFWSLYPLYWLLSPLGFNLITLTQLLIASHITHIFTKAVFYLLMCWQLKALDAGSKGELT